MSPEINNAFKCGKPHSVEESCDVMAEASQLAC